MQHFEIVSGKYSSVFCKGLFANVNTRIDDLGFIPKLYLLRHLCNDSQHPNTKGLYRPTKFVPGRAVSGNNVAVQRHIVVSLA